MEKMRSHKLLAPLVAVTLLAGGAGSAQAQFSGGSLTSFSLVRPKPVQVARGAMVVTPTIHWNRIPRGRSDIYREENWTLNGPALDGLSFIGGLQHNERIVEQYRRADQKVPDFRSDMTPQEIVDMIESYYLIRGGSVSFDMTGLAPRPFLGQPGFQFDYRRLAGNEVERQGRGVAAVINGRLYMALYDAARLHYFGAGVGEFERIANSARLR